MPVLARADDALFRRLHRNPSPLLDKYLPPLSRAANHGLLWMGVAAVLAATGNKANRRAALRGTAGLAAASAIANGPAKLLTRRRRPTLDGVALIRQLRQQPLTSSFPSGHSASAAAFATGVALERPVLGVGVGVLASGVAYSRVHTGVHYPGDVVAGVALGALASYALTRVWPVRRQAPERYRAPDADLPALPDGAGLVVVANSKAGDGKPAEVQRVADALPGAKVREVGEGEDLVAVLAEAAAEARVLGMAGGDGSINAAARAALDAGVPLLVVPAGTLNHFAHEVGVDSVDEAIDAVRQGSGALVDVVCAELPDGSGREIFLNNASIGAYPEMVAAREQLEGRLGKWPAMLVALARILRRSEPVEVEVDGVHRRLWLLFAGNCVYSPPGFAPSWRDRLDDGLLDLRLIDATHPYSRSRLVIAVLTGRLARTPVFEARTATEVSVRSLAGGVRLARDGEVGEPVGGFRLLKDCRLRVYRT